MKAIEHKPDCHQQSPILGCSILRLIDMIICLNASHYRFSTHSVSTAFDRPGIGVRARAADVVARLEQLPEVSTAFDRPGIGVRHGTRCLNKQRQVQGAARREDRLDSAPEWVAYVQQAGNALNE